jgi:hypothetical protein
VRGQQKSGKRDKGRKRRKKQGEEAETGPVTASDGERKWSRLDYINGNSTTTEHLPTRPENPTCPNVSGNPREGHGPTELPQRNNEMVCPEIYTLPQSPKCQDACPTTEKSYTNSPLEITVRRVLELRIKKWSKPKDRWANP